MLIKKIKIWIQKHREPFDRWILHRQIKKLTKAIWKYALKDSLEPKYSKKDAETLSLAIHWNNADLAKEVLAYEGENGEMIFPR